MDMLLEIGNSKLGKVFQIGNINVFWFTCFLRMGTDNAQELWRRNPML